MFPIPSCPEPRHPGETRKRGPQTGISQQQDGEGAGGKMVSEKMKRKMESK